MIVATWTFLELDPTLRISIAAVDAPGKLQQRAVFFFLRYCWGSGTPKLRMSVLCSKHVAGQKNHTFDQRKFGGI